MNEKQSYDDDDFIKNFTKRQTMHYPEIARDILDTYMQKPGIVDAKDVVRLYGTIAKLGIGARRIQGMLADLRRERRPPDAAERGAFYRYFDLVDELATILEDLNIAILDAYRPGLAARFAQFKHGDELIYDWFRAIAPEFHIVRRDMPSSLKRILEDWWADGLSPKLELETTFITISPPYKVKTPSDEDLQILEVLSEDMKSLAEEIGGIIRENWSLAEIAEAGKPTLRVQVGDYYANIGAGAVIVNRSSLHNALNEIHLRTNNDHVLWTLERVVEEAERSGNETAIELCNAVIEELGRPEPRKAVLRSTLESLENILGWSGLNEQILKLFD